MIGQLFDDDENRWIVPSDRHLALLGTLGTGWSTVCTNTGYKKSRKPISEAEQELIITVLERNEDIQIQEQYRIGRLVTRFEHTKTNTYGDGILTCLICGTKPGLFRDLLHFCGICGHLICSKCSIDYRTSCNTFGKLYTCVICNEGKVLLKRSGAWFYKEIPKFLRPGEVVDKNRRISSRPSRGSLDSDFSDDMDYEAAIDLPIDPFSSQHSGIDMEESQRRMSSSLYSRHKRSLGSISESSSNNDKYSLSREASSTSSNSLKDMPNVREEEENSSLTHNPAPRNSMVETPNLYEDTIGNFRKLSRTKPISSSDDTSKELKDADKEQIDPIPENDGEDIDALFISFEEKENEKKSEYTGLLGKIKFTLQYNSKTQDLLVIIDSCNGLKFGEKESDVIPSAYIKSMLLPVQTDSAKSSKKRTPTMKKTPDPVYNFCIVYPGVTAADIEHKGLQLSVIDETNFKNKYTIGETCVQLKSLTNDPIQQFRRILDPRAQVDSLYLDVKKVETKAGRIEVSLQYLSKEKILIVGVIRCVNLKALDPNGYSDPYVKCYLLPDTEKKSKRKSGIKKKTLNPVFNEVFEFEIAHSELAQKSLYLAVWDYDVGRTNDFIGGVQLGIGSKGPPLHHWFETLKSCDEKFTRWHDLDEKCQLFND